MRDARRRMRSPAPRPAWRMLLETSSLTSSRRIASRSAPTRPRRATARRAAPAAEGAAGTLKSISGVTGIWVQSGNAHRLWRTNPRASLDVALGAIGGPGVAPRHQDEALELGDEEPVLVEDAGVHADRTAGRLGLRLALLEDLGLAEQRVPVEHRGGVLELLRGEVRDRLAADVGDAHPERQRVDERADDDVAPLLGLRGVHVVDVQRVVVHRQQAEEVVVALGDGLRRPVLVDGADLELLEVAPVGMRAARLAGGLIGVDSGCVLGHWPAV